MAGERVICTDTDRALRVRLPPDRRRRRPHDARRDRDRHRRPDRRGAARRAASAASRLRSRERDAPRRARDRRRPFRFTTSGRRADARRAHARAGLRQRRRRRRGQGGAQDDLHPPRRRSRRTCSYRSRVTFRSRSRFPRSGRLTVRVRFLGNAVLGPRRAKSVDRSARAERAWPTIPSRGSAPGSRRRPRPGCPSPRARRSRRRRPTGGRRCATCSCAVSTSAACASSPTTAAARAASSTPIRSPRSRCGGRALQRQLRAEGPVERLGAEESDAYFASRGRGSRLGALASRQGSVIPGREVLDERRRRARRALRRGDPAPGLVGRLPPAPDAIEFWEGRANRLHDRSTTCATATAGAASASAREQRRRPPPRPRRSPPPRR